MLLTDGKLVVGVTAKDESFILFDKTEALTGEWFDDFFKHKVESLETGIVISVVAMVNLVVIVVVGINYGSHLLCLLD
jgi:hypothetical protein